MVEIHLAPLLFGVAVAVIIIVVLIYELIKAQDGKKNYIDKYNKELHFRKSSEIRLGKIGENLAPFLKDWPWDPKRFRFLGNPVDGIQFNKDGIVFVEIKTGKAQLSRAQKTFRDLVKDNKVSFVTFKITENGCKLVKTE